VSRPPADPLPDVAAILEVLVRHEVDFVVIGGVAVAHHGFVRATRDVDVIPHPARANLVRLRGALEELEARPASLRDFRPEELPAPFTREGLLNLGSWDLETKYGRLEILQYVVGKLEDTTDYKRLRDAADAGRYDFGTVWFASYEDLIDFKNIAGRDQDLIDIRALREARGDARP
jgi:hypothetical protein